MYIIKEYILLIISFSKKILKGLILKVVFNDISNW